MQTAKDISKLFEDKLYCVIYDHRSEDGKLTRTFVRATSTVDAMVKAGGLRETFMPPDEEIRNCKNFLTISYRTREPSFEV